MPERKIRFEVRYVPAGRLMEVYGKVSQQLPDGFLPPAELELIDVCSLRITRREANHPLNLDTVYRCYQSVDKTPEERTTQLGQRSMTLGDAFVVDGRVYYVVDPGFVARNELGQIEAVTEDNYNMFPGAA